MSLAIPSNTLITSANLNTLASASIVMLSSRLLISASIVLPVGRRKSIVG